MRNINLNLEYHLQNKNYLTYIFFSIYLIIGLFIFKDFGISFDENINRLNGFVSLKYIINKFSIPLDLENINLHMSFIKTIPNIANYWDNVYGVVFDLPLAIIEVIFNIDDSRNIYLLRHLSTFLIFFLSTICFYNLINYHFKNKSLALTGVLFLILSPRIFANSFYNSKDIVFLAFFIFSIYFSLKALNYKTIKYIILAGFFSALCSGSRVVGSYLPFLTILFYYLINEKDKTNFSNLRFSTYLLSFFFIFLFLFWPYLWGNPILNFVHALTKLGNFPYEIYVLYLGDYVNSKYIPWHYFFVWFSITTPPLILLLILIGIFFTSKDLIVNFVNIKKESKYLLWKNNNEMNESFIFLSFLIPVFLIVIFNSTLYGGWRQLYFIYPPLVFLGVRSLVVLNKKFNDLIKRIVYFLLFIQLSLVFNFLIQSHPLQFTYFGLPGSNFINDRFYVDYWGVGNQYSIKKLVSQKEINLPIKVAAASFTDLNKTKLILTKENREKFIFLGSEKKEAEYVFTNYYYHVPPKIDKRYEIPENFNSLIKLNIKGLLINEIFKKR